MLWLTWRQHRLEVLAAVLLLTALAVPLFVTGFAMHEEYVSDGVAACVASPVAGCDGIVEQFLNRHDEWGNRFVWVTFLVALAGVFIGAPLLGREFEHGTWRLAVTQTVTRTRWLAAKLALVGSGVTVVAGICSVLFTWWRSPLDAIGGHLRTAAFAVTAPSLVPSTLFAFALGAFAGTLLRRTIPAMVATLVTFLAVRIYMEEAARPHYVAPVTRIGGPSLARTDWPVTTGWIDSSGRLLPERERSALVRQIGGDTERFMSERGLRHFAEFHPDSSLGTFQAIEAATLLGAAAVLFAATVWIVRRHTT